MDETGNAEQFQAVIQGALSNLVPNLIQQLVPLITRELQATFEGRIRALETNCFLLNSQLHRVLEDIEISKNRTNYSDIILYGVPKGRTPDKELAVELITKLVGSDTISKMEHDIVVDTVRMASYDPKPNEAQPLIVTLGSDALRDAVFKHGNRKIKNDKDKKLGLPTRMKDNVTRETRWKRRVLGFIAQKLRDGGHVAVVPFDARAKLLVSAEVRMEGTKAKEKIPLRRFTYESAIAEFGKRMAEHEKSELKKGIKNQNLHSILLI